MTIFYLGSRMGLMESPTLTPNSTQCNMYEAKSLLEMLGGCVCLPRALQLGKDSNLLTVGKFVQY